MAERPPRRQRAPRLRRIERPGLLVAVILVLALATAGAFFVGRLTTAPSRDQILAAQQPIDVTAKAETRVVNTEETYAATIRAGSAIDVIVFGPQPAVVVRRTLDPGNTVGYGALLGVVSGQPYYALPAPLPLYRDLLWDDEGDDVTALQTSLQVAGFSLDVTGVIDRPTMTAVRTLYENGGFELGSTGPISYQQLVPITSASGSVTTVADVGAKLDAETPLLSIQVAAPQVVLRADAIASSELEVGEAMTVSMAGTRFAATIASIGPFSDGTDGTPPGRDVSLTNNDPTLTGLAVGTFVSVQVADDSSEKSLAVPLTALREDDDGTFVQRETRKNGMPTFERVNVTVSGSGNGWAAINDGDLHNGDSVRVS